MQVYNSTVYIRIKIPHHGKMFLRRCYILNRLNIRRNLNIELNISTISENSLYFLCKHLKIDECQAKYIQLKQPVLKKITEGELKTLIETINDLGFSNKILFSYPELSGILPVTLKFRFRVLQECGLRTVTPASLITYLNLVKRKTIGELRSSGHIPNHVNIENRLAGYLTQWPTSLTTLVYSDVNDLTLYSLRLKIIQRYLELVLDINTSEFFRGLKTYPTIKHRPLEVINETLNVLHTQIKMASSKIKSNLYLIHADPDNLKNILYKFKYIGGIDVKEAIRLHPKIAMKNYSSLLEIRKVLQEFNISKEAQRRCLEIYTLSPVTIRDRLETTKNIPEFLTYFKHPRFLKMIYYNKTATQRLVKLYNHDKMCVSLNVLLNSSMKFEATKKAPGDRSGTGKDLVFCISEILKNTFSSNDIRNTLKRHPFWINVPLVRVKYVGDHLLKDFSTKDIYDNCSILLYPWNKIRNVLYMLNHNMQELLPNDHLVFSKLNNSQKLSLTLYLLEKNHYFSGNGIWTEDKYRSSELASQVRGINENNVEASIN